MERRGILILGLACMASLWTAAMTRAQDVTITNLSQLTEMAFSQDYCVYLPWTPWQWQVYSTDNGEPWWIDCSQLDCTNLLSTSTNLGTGLLMQGVPFANVVLTMSIMTGDTTLQTDGTTNILAVVPAPSGYEPGAQLGVNVWVWREWQQITNCLDCWGLTAGDIPPPVATLKARLSDVNNYGIYASNMEALAEAATASAASTMSGSFMAMDDDDGGDPCFITNPAAPFFVTSITRETNGTLVTWQSCPNMIYWVASAQMLTTNTYWVWQPPTMFGQNGATSWEDITTTNGSNVTSRFYKVGRRLPILIAAGDSYSLTVSPNGTLWGFGGDATGQLGDGTTGQGPEEDQPWPQPMLDPTNCLAGTLTNVQALAAGSGFSVAADFNGVAWSWGNDGFTGGNDVPPSQVSTVSNVVSLACGSGHTLALRSDGAVFAWGVGSMGQLGVTNPPIFTTNAMQSIGLTNIIAVAHSVALQANGNVWVFGDNGSGQFGNGGTVSTNVPILVTTISNVIAIAAGGYHTLAIISNQTLWTFGDNDQGQLGHDGNNLLPGQVAGLSNVVAIAGGYAFSMAVTSNGNIYAWGDNTYSELGTNYLALASTNRPMLVRTLSNAVLVAASPVGNGDHSLAVTVNQGVYQYWGWGQNTSGQVGNGQDGSAGTNLNQDTPELIQLTNRCVQCVQLGASGIFTAQCTGTLRLFFNDDVFNDNGTLSYTVTIGGLASNVAVVGSNNVGVAVGAVTNGLTYTYIASGFCSYDSNESPSSDVDPNGNNRSGIPIGCTGPNGTGATPCGFVCPDTICYSLVGRITQ
jgi:alpha-tubulin suppressor-like RCC1 family protein